MFIPYALSVNQGPVARIDVLAFLLCLGIIF